VSHRHMQCDMTGTPTHLTKNLDNFLRKQKQKNDRIIYNSSNSSTNPEISWCGDFYITLHSHTERLSTSTYLISTHSIQRV
jgi:hypothetical protein